MEDKKQMLIDALEKLRKKEVANKEPWKARAYATVIKGLKSLEGPVHTYDDVKDIKGLGTKLEAKVKELLDSGTLKQLENYNASGNIESVNDLLRIHGIGPAKANDLVTKHNIRTIADLQKHQDLLNDVQKLGLKYYEDIEKRIPRKEMEKHDAYLTQIVKCIDPKMEATITGSYRRQMKDSGDIDVLITHPDNPVEAEDLFKQVIDRLKRDGYIKDTFALGTKKCLAMCRLPLHRSFRRIDLLYTHPHEYPFALLYFTGSATFNVDMRNIALSKGYTLSEYGLKHSKGDNKGDFVDKTFKKEKDIFDFLGLDYVEPQDRLTIKS
jgi:DNA polymerase beta